MRSDNVPKGAPAERITKKVLTIIKLKLRVSLVTPSWACVARVAVRKGAKAKVGLGTSPCVR